MSAFDTRSPGAKLLLGTVIFLGATAWLLSVVAFVARAEKAEGTVTDLYSCRSRRRSRTCGDVTYTRANGLLGRVENVRSPGSMGARMEVLYDPVHPEDARVNGLFNLWLFPLILETLGVAFLIDSARKFLAESARS